MDDLHRGVVPTHWAQYYDTEELIVSTWMIDLMLRLQQLQELSKRVVAKQSGESLGKVWLGGLFYPEAFIASTRQQTAQQLGVSLEDLYLSVAVGQEEGVGFVVTGMVLEGGAVIVNGHLEKSRVMRQMLPLTLFSWLSKDGNEQKEDEVEVPLYLNLTRQKLVLTVNLQSKSDVDEFSRRGTAIVSWSGE